MSSVGMHNLQTCSDKLLAKHPELTGRIRNEDGGRWSVTLPRHNIEVSVKLIGNMMDATVRNLPGEHCLLTHTPLVGVRGLMLIKQDNPKVIKGNRTWEAALYMSGELVVAGDWSELENGDRVFLAELVTGELEKLVDALMNATA